MSAHKYLYLKDRISFAKGLFETLTLRWEACWYLLESLEIAPPTSFDLIRVHKCLHFKDKIFSYIVLRELPGFVHIKVS